MPLSCFFKACWGIAFGAGILLISSPNLSAQIRTSVDMPVKGETVTIELAEPVPFVEVIYRPNSALARRDTIHADEPTTSFPFVPDEAGIVTVFPGGQSSGGDRRNLSIRFKGTSEKGLVVMILAGCILFGGVVFAFSILFRSDRPTDPTEIEHHADT